MSKVRTIKVYIICGSKAPSSFHPESILLDETLQGNLQWLWSNNIIVTLLFLYRVMSPTSFLMKIFLGHLRFERLRVTRSAWALLTTPSAKQLWTRWGSTVHDHQNNIMGSFFAKLKSCNLLPSLLMNSVKSCTLLWLLLIWCHAA